MKKENFTQELQVLSPFLADLRKQVKVTMSAPEQYFEQLENKILEKIDNEVNIENDILPSELKKWQPTAPSGYFDNLANRILEKATVNQEDENTLLLSELKNWQPTAPSGYFDNLADEILAKTNKKKAPQKLLAQLYTLKISHRVGWVAAASVALLLAFTWFFGQNKNMDNSQVIVNNNTQNIGNQNIITLTENKTGTETPQIETPKNTPAPKIITPTTPETTDFNPNMTTTEKIETSAVVAQTDYQNSKNDLEVLNKNLAKILLEAHTEGGELLDLLQFSDEELEAAIGGGK